MAPTSPFISRSMPLNDIAFLVPSPRKNKSAPKTLPWSKFPSEFGRKPRSPATAPPGFSLRSRQPGRRDRAGFLQGGLELARIDAGISVNRETPRAILPLVYMRETFR
jgi:hypothetical protein